MVRIVEDNFRSNFFFSPLFPHIAAMSATAAVFTELDEVCANARDLAIAHEELIAQLSSIESNLSRALAEVHALPTIKADIETMHCEIQ